MEEVKSKAKMMAQSSSDRLIKTLSAVPDDKLNWSPSATSNSALQIAAHAGLSSGFLANAIRGEKMPDFGSPEEMHEKMSQAVAQLKTREDVVKMIDGNNTAFQSSVDSLSDEACESTVTLPFGSFPMTMVMFFPSMHMDNHAAQIDYIQTIWGDTSDHR
jgi:hypothetical protein